MYVEPRPIHITTLGAYHNSSNRVAENSDIKLRNLKFHLRIRLAWQLVCVLRFRSLYGTFLPMLAGKHPRYLRCFSTLVSCWYDIRIGNSCTQQVSGTEMPKPKEGFFFVACICLRAIHATYGTFFWAYLYVYRGRGGSVISARFILARTTTDKSNGRSGRRGQKKEEEEELGEACFILRASSMMHK